MRDFRRLLAGVRCWDAEAQALYERHGEVLDDRALQDPEELVLLCRFIEERGIRSYLEVGAWTGALARTLHAIFDFELVAVADDGWCRRFGLELRPPPGARVFVGNTRSAAYRAWLGSLPRIDLVFIDADHSYRGVRADFELHRAHPHRFVALHDIVNPDPRTAGVPRLWRELAHLPRRELVRAGGGGGGPRMGIGIVAAPGERP